MQDSKFCWHRCADRNYISAGLQQGIVRRGFLRRRRSKGVVLCFLLLLYFDPEYESLSQIIHPPMVCIDNDTYDDCSLVMVDSANRHEILLEVVQVLTDLDLVISKADISSDGGWFMNVFHVTDQLGNKKYAIESIHNRIQKSSQYAIESM